MAVSSSPAFGTGTTSNAVKCFNYIYDLRTKQKQNIVVTNSSWGGGSPSRALREAMGRVDSPLHVCSAGNSNSNRKLYPAAYDLDNIISVAATDHDDIYAGFSSWGEDWGRPCCPRCKHSFNDSVRPLSHVFAVRLWVHERDVDVRPLRYRRGRVDLV